MGMDAKRFGNRALLLITLAMLAPALVIAAQDSAQRQVKTAEQHAAFAAKAQELDQTHLHLHHVINCLVGPGGDGFDASAGNPCEGQGKGALNDIKGSKQEQQTLEHALSLATIGTEIRIFQPAHDTAMAVDELLKAAIGGT